MPTGKPHGEAGRYLKLGEVMPDNWPGEFRLLAARLAEASVACSRGDDAACAWLEHRGQQLLEQLPLDDLERATDALRRSLSAA